VTRSARNHGRLASLARVLIASLSIGGLLIATIIVALDAFGPETYGGSSGIVAKCGNSEPAQSILLLGDSYVNNLDIMLSAVMCNSDIATNVHVTTLAAGGETMAGHVANGEAAQISGSDVVVLQEQSEIPGFGPYDDQYQTSTAAIERLATAATAAHARVVLEQTWGHQHGDSGNPQIFPTYAVMQSRLVTGYAAYLSSLQYGAAPDARVARVGQAWQWVEQRNPGLFAALYEADGSHPSLSGRYLGALVLAQEISRTALPARPWKPPGVSSRDANLLQEAARAEWQATQ
jgi:hypothetical protein